MTANTVNNQAQQKLMNGDQPNGKAVKNWTIKYFIKMFT